MRFSCRQQLSMIRRAACLLAVMAACVVVGGCGNGLANVSGQITLDGQPLRGGKGDVRVTVQFQPADGIGATAIGLADENGNYVIATGSQSGIRPGVYYVACSQSVLGKPKGPDATPDSKYANTRTSGLKFTIEPGRNEINIPLESEAKRTTQRGA